MAPTDPGLDGRPQIPDGDLGGLAPTGSPKDIGGIGTAHLGGEPGAAEADAALRDLGAGIAKKSYAGEGLKVDGAKLQDIVSPENEANVTV